MLVEQKDVKELIEVNKKAQRRDKGLVALYRQPNSL